LSAGRWGRSRPTSGRYGSRTRCCAPRPSPAPRTTRRTNTPHDFLYTETLNEAIWSDPGWNGWEYASNEEVVDGLKRHVHIWGIMGFSTEFWKQEAWRGLDLESQEDFLENFLEPYFTVMDPNDLLCMAWKWQRGDVARNTGGNLSEALGRITAKTFVMPIDEDMFFPPRDGKAEQEMIAGSEFRVVEDIGGHLGLFAITPTYMPRIDQHLGDLFATEV
jgi:homoserine O-acetyltransferase/O-succinyltransferase